MKDDFEYTIVAESSNPSDNSEGYNIRVLDEEAERAIRRKNNAIVAKYTTILVLLGIIFMAGFSIYLYYDFEKNWALDSPSKYKLIYELPDDNTYYEIDFSKNVATKRKDYENKKRSRIYSLTGERASGLKRIQSLFEEITSDNSNIVLTRKERNNLFKNRCYWIIKIQTYQGTEYYVKDPALVRQILNALGERY